MTCCFPSSNSRRDCDSFLGTASCRTDGGNDSVRKFGGGTCFASTGLLVGGLVSFWTKYLPTAIAGGTVTCGACGCLWSGYMVYSGQVTPCDPLCCGSRSDEEGPIYKVG